MLLKFLRILFIVVEYNMKLSSFFFRVIGKVFNQDVFPDSVLIGRANEKKKKRRHTTVPIDLHENTNNHHSYSSGISDSPAKSIDIAEPFQ